jgi:two-component system chemotaxis response regulator CheB
MTANKTPAIVIGASAGAVAALTEILPKLPKDFSAAIMIVVHLPPDKKSVLAELFQEKCQLRVKEAEDKENIKAGTVYFAPPDYHLLVEPDGRLSLSTEEPELFSRPSIDVLFETAADAYGAALTGIILTGANTDGAAGLKAIVQAGGKAIVQRPELAYAAAMPQAALNLCPDAEMMTLQEIAAFFQKPTPPCQL